MFQALFLAVAVVSTVASAAPQMPPRDGAPAPPSAREAQLAGQIAASAAELPVYLEVSRLQEQRRAYREAETTLVGARAAFGADSRLLQAIAAFYNRRGRFDATMEVLEQAAALEPSNPAGYHLIGTYYHEKAARDSSLSQEDKLQYIRKGIEAEDRALALDADHVEALAYKNIFLRMLAIAETDPARQQGMLAEADQLRTRAMELQKQRAGARMAAAPGAPPPPPPPAAPASAAQLVDGEAPVRVGGNIRPPTKIRDVRPMYPPDAQIARVQGVVIIEALIDASGQVRDGKILRSVPLLDQAALDAVLQWQFTPTIVDGIPRPVIMTVTVNFTLQD